MKTGKALIQNCIAWQNASICLTAFGFYSDGNSKTYLYFSNCICSGSSFVPLRRLKSRSVLKLYLVVALLLDLPIFFLNWMAAGKQFVLLELFACITFLLAFLSSLMWQLRLDLIWLLVFQESDSTRQSNGCHNN